MKHMRGRTVTNIYKSFFAIALAVIIGMTLAGSAGAHFSSTGYSDIKVGADTIQYHLSILESDFVHIFPDKPDGGDKISDKQLTGSIEVLTKLVDDGLIVTGDGKIGNAVITGVKHEKRASMDMIGIDIRYKFAATVKQYLMQYNFFWYSGVDVNHSNYATIQVGGQTIQQVLGSQNYIVQIQGPGAAVGNPPAAAPPAALDAKPAVHMEATSWLSTLKTYVLMGMEHIWSGLDHMLFVLGLLLAAEQRVWKIVRLITAFTIGHCITLVLSSLEVAYLSPKIVEPLIALSILYIAVENIWKRKESARVIVTLLFGLVHGFGFAEVLRGTLSGHMALPLFSFNLGVEIGQLVVVAIVIPVLLWIRRMPLQMKWNQYASGIIGVFGLYWLIERIISQ
ncbi:HupE/UreJ family protein [Paenibacillus chondroitinus]|uniref:HupE/UreJ family protein n=1 Tax=Paenibacillus chondroitinus TaxID=59842 RepID=A0ABU6DMB7_9BACL|nr:MULTISPECIES: HupE/UreJ family protein [Paenibacillus]MCY9661014.1 HupE/UreJ family protein [Paenibacillus anseongense]MEB4797927.1 HupE/UreJ family protein [Paenibacillus chondroitinus]